MIQSSPPDEFAARLSMIIATRGGAVHLATKSGIGLHRLRRLARGHAEPRMSEVVRIALVTALRPGWLIMGDGQCFLEIGLYGLPDNLRSLCAYYGVRYCSVTEMDGSHAAGRRAKNRWANFSARKAPPAADPAQPPENCADPHGQPAQRLPAAILPPVATANPKTGLLRRLAGRIGSALTSYSTGAAA